MQKFLVVVLFMISLVPAVAGAECPKGEGFRANLFDKDNVNWVLAEGRPVYFAPESVAHQINSHAGGYYESHRTFYISCKPNTTYTFFVNDSIYMKRVGSFSTVPAMGESPHTFVQSRERSITITTGADDDYLCVQLYTDNDYSSGARSSNIIESIKIYENSDVSYYEHDLAVDKDCAICPPNTYKDFVGNEPCTPCPDDTLSPSGAKSADECGRILHVGTKIYHLNSVNKTSPSLNIMDENGNIFYGNLYSEE